MSDFLRSRSVVMVGFWWSDFVGLFVRVFLTFCGLRWYFSLLLSCSEPGLHFDWRGFIAKWFVIRVFRFRVVEWRVILGWPVMVAQFY